jgi:hypothetical protein
MSISNQLELESSLGKLAVLERDAQKFAAMEPNEALRRAMRITLGRLINQFKEEIGRYQAGSRGDPFAHRALQNEEQANNTRRKLAALESLLAKTPSAGRGNADCASMSSLRRMRNELKEQLLTYEVRSRQLTTHQR